MSERLRDWAKLQDGLSSVGDALQTVLDNRYIGIDLTLGRIVVNPFDYDVSFRRSPLPRREHEPFSFQGRILRETMFTCAQGLQGPVANITYLRAPHDLATRIVRSWEKACKRLGITEFVAGYVPPEQEALWRELGYKPLDEPHPNAVIALPTYYKSTSLLRHIRRGSRGRTRAHLP
jgi:hypothetical protein